MGLVGLVGLVVVLGVWMWMWMRVFWRYACMRDEDRGKYLRMQLWDGMGGVACIELVR